jgi:serine protease Do
MRKFTEWGPAALVLIATFAALAFAPSLVRRVEFAQTDARVTLARQALGEDDILARIDAAVRRVAESVAPSVVHIDVSVDGRRYFVRSSGSGWIYDRSGHLVTNSHVLRGAETFTVQLNDGRLFRAELAGADPLTDIAVLRLPKDASDIIPAVRASGEQPRQGERVFAFGSPFGFKFSMSEGIISGLGREPAGAVAASSGYTNFIQTDAAVNPGNSGGPLVNIRGEVVGMNVAIATGSESEGTTDGQSAGISFAIPLVVIESVVDQLIEHGSVRRGFLGVSLPSSAQVQRAGYNGFGVFVPGVSEGGPAERAGLKPDDVILAIDGQSVTGVGVLRSLISTIQPGEEVAIDVWRDGERLTVRPVLDEAPPALTIGRSIETELGRFGLAIRVERDEEGEPAAYVRGVFRGAPAAEAGFEIGQRIVSVAGQPVRGSEDLINALERAGLLLGRAVPVVVENPDLDGETPERATFEIRIRR